MEYNTSIDYRIYKFNKSIHEFGKEVPLTTE